MKSIIVRIMPGILCAFAALTAQAELGFYRTDDPRIPPAVREASKAVYQLVTQGVSLERPNIKVVDTVASYNDFRNPADFWFRLQLDMCIHNSLALCEIFEDSENSTAFTMGRKDLLYSTFHSFFDVIDLRVRSFAKKNQTDEEVGSILRIRPPFFALSNAVGKNLFDPRKASGYFEFIQPNLSILSQGREALSTVRGRLMDLLVIRLTVPMAKALIKSDENINENMDVYLVGFPAMTNNRKNIGAGDSDGKSQYVSKGKVVSFHTWAMNSSFTYTYDEQKLMERELIFFDADCVPGMSGGPILDSKGKVLGVELGNNAGDVLLGQRTCVGHRIQAAE